MKHLLYIGIFLFLALVSCKKDPTDSYKKHSITSPDLLNCFYKTNSYWVYIDSVTNIVDSVYVIDHNYDTLISHTLKEVYEIYTYRTKSSETIETIDYVVISSGLREDYNGEVGSGTWIYDDYYDISENGSQYFFECIDSMFIFDHFYYNIVKTDFPPDPSQDSNKITYYINSDFGVLRHDVYSDTVLLSSKILMRKNIVR